MPFADKAIPAWLHLPVGYAGGRIPAVIAIPGMDSFKEMQVALYGDRFLNRGMAVLAIDGPGQYEAPMIGLYFSVESWMAAGRALVERNELRHLLRHNPHRARAAHPRVRLHVGVP